MPNEPLTATEVWLREQPPMKKWNQLKILLELAISYEPLLDERRKTLETVKEWMESLEKLNPNR